MSLRNPKQEGTNVFDCRVQTGKCPINCNQCFYNRENAYYSDINQPDIPSIEEVGDNGIVRMNCGHDSNIEREKCIETAQKYKHYFFGTSIPNFDFPGPVVFTANRDEEELIPFLDVPKNMMFIRLRVSSTNLHLIKKAVAYYSKYVPVILTFMAYYTEPPEKENYEWRVRHINSYWCAKKDFIVNVVDEMKAIGGRMVALCGAIDHNYCISCKNCETYYWQTIKHMKETK